MFRTRLGQQYPEVSVEVVPFQEDLGALFTKPEGLVEEWPPQQVTYLGIFLTRLNCKTIVVENHYIDGDYVDDLAVFYARSLRNYPNHCQRLHFFSSQFDRGRFDQLLDETNQGRGVESEKFLQDGYLGFVVVRPLPGYPVGRTVLSTFGDLAEDGSTRRFGAVRDYDVNLSGFQLTIRGLAFQQQDQGVSACATTALWSALHKVTKSEELASPTPAEITEAASRYVLAGGRALPSDGLTAYQMCEAIRAAGLAPLIISAVGPEVDKAELSTYVDSGFPVVIALKPLVGSEGHAVCVVGTKVGRLSPQTDPAIVFTAESDAIKALYVHDDRLGPYAVAEIQPFTLPRKDSSDETRIVTSLLIRWPSKEEWELSLLRAMIVPVPVKLRLTATRMRKLGMQLAQWTGGLLESSVTLSCRYLTGVVYKRAAASFGLNDDGFRQLVTQTIMSRYLGVIRIASNEGPLYDVLIDATETSLNPSVLACVVRGEPFRKDPKPLTILAKELGAVLIQ